MFKHLLTIIFCLASLAAQANDLEEIDSLLKKKYNLNIETFSFLLMKNDHSMSGSKKFWNHEGGFPWQVYELEKKGYLYLLTYSFGKDGLGYKVYPTAKTYKILSSTRSGSVWTPENVHRNIESARKSGKYTYITKQQ